MQQLIMEYELVSRLRLGRQYLGSGVSSFHNVTGSYLVVTVLSAPMCFIRFCTRTIANGKAVLHLSRNGVVDLCLYLGLRFCKSWILPQELRFFRFVALGRLIFLSLVCMFLFFGRCFLLVPLISFFFRIVTGDDVFHVHVLFFWTSGFLAMDVGSFKYFLNSLLHLRFWCEHDSRSWLFLDEPGSFFDKTVFLSTLVTLDGRSAIGASLCMWSLGLFPSALGYT